MALEIAQGLHATVKRNPAKPGHGHSNPPHLLAASGNPPHRRQTCQTANTLDADGCFALAGLTRAFWATASPHRDIFRAAFLHAGLPSYRPPSFRHMLVQVAYQRKLSHAQLKAWSQNLGHESLLTTLSSYGKIPLEQQGQLIRGSTAAAGDNDSDFKEQVRRLLG